MLVVARLLRGFGWFLLRLPTDVRRDGSAAASFAHLWAAFQRFYYVFKLREFYFNRFSAPIENAMFSTLVGVVRKRYPAYQPRVEIRNSALIAEIIDPNQKTIVLTIHNRLSMTIVEVLSQNGARCSIFSVADNKTLFGGLNANADCKVIAPGSAALLTARQHLADRRVICCHPDYGPNWPLNVVPRLFIRTGIFEFAHRMEARIFFALAQASESGAVVVQLADPAFAPSASAAHKAEDFAAFLHANSTNRQHWTVCG